MLLSKIVGLLNAQTLTSNTLLDIECEKACGSDLMSDVLAFSKEKTILLTGLVNIQVIRTAEMMDIKVVIFVRGKIPSEDIINFANSRDIVILVTDKALYESSGILYSNGLGKEN